MPIFRYKAFTKEKKLQTGMAEANSRDYVEDILREKGFEEAKVIDALLG